MTARASAATSSDAALPVLVLPAGVVVSPCRPVGAPADWPELHLRVLQHGLDCAQALDRDHARRLARQLLAAQAGAEPAARLLALPPQQRGGQPASLAHDTGVTLLAWCGAGAVGVDVVALASLADASVEELQASAALYLGPAVADVVAAAPDTRAARRLLAGHWAVMEARLKCLGLALDEWQPAREVLLASIAWAPVLATNLEARQTSDWIGCVAWRNDTPAAPGRCR